MIKIPQAAQASSLSPNAQHKPEICSAQHLAQPWLETPEPHFQPSTVQFAWSATHLHVRVELQDHHLFSTATDHNQSLYLLGDTLEVFLMLPGAPEYYELHVSPHNHRAFLRWPIGAIQHLRKGDGRRVEDFQENPHCFASGVELLEKMWKVWIDIPSTLLGLEHYSAGQQLLLSVSRYDYADLETPPVLSTIAAHPIKNFHRTEDWLFAELQPGA